MNTLTHLCILQEREIEREYIVEEEQLFLFLEFTLYLVEFYTKEFCRVFSFVVSSRKIFVFYCVVVLVFIVFISVFLCLWLWCYDDKCFISCITIKNITWYQTYPKKNLCAIEIVLQLQLLKIKLLSLKTLKDQN